MTTAAYGVHGIRLGSACPLAVEATLPPEKDLLAYGDAGAR